MGGTPSQITAGMRVQFFNGDVDPIEGVVNGDPWVYFDGIDAVARIPVHVQDTNQNIDVDGRNIYRVGVEPASVKA